MKIAIIKWTDSSLNGNRQCKADDKDLNPMSMVTCGVLVKEDKKGITIAHDDIGDGYFRTCETVYRKQIDYYEIKEVKVGKLKI
jgi:hypothetical protein